MTIKQSYKRQPTKFDYAAPTQFKFTITKLPKVEFFCTAVNLPGISLEGTMAQETPLKDIPISFSLDLEDQDYGYITTSYAVTDSILNPPYLAATTRF